MPERSHADQRGGPEILGTSCVEADEPDKPVLALDLDSTLAATEEVAFDLLCGDDHDYGYDDVESWGWGLTEFGKWRFLSAMWHAWTIRPAEIEPCEPIIQRATHDLVDAGWTVHVVTANPPHGGIMESKQAWLNDHGVAYQGLVRAPMDTSKARMGYDAYVDDKPGLPKAVAEVNPDADVYLYDRRYNRDELVDGPHTRVASIEEVPPP